jgi:hypothetical protein
MFKGLGSNLSTYKKGGRRGGEEKEGRGGRKGRKERGRKEGNSSHKRPHAMIWSICYERSK